MMTKQQRESETQKGRIILRSQFDSRSGSWKIVKYSRFGGWKRFGGNWYYSDKQCKDAIAFVCANMSSRGMYIDEANYSAQ